MVARGRAMNMQTSTRPREHKQCADNPDAAQLMPNFAERERDLQIIIIFMDRSNTSQSLSKSASPFKRRSVRQSTTRSRCVTTSKQDQRSCRRKFCQLSDKMKIIVAKYCCQLSNNLKMMQLPARTTCATQCTTTSAKQSTTPYRCKTDHRN